MNDYQRDELLIRMDERVAHLVKVVDGNGNPGLVEKVAVLEGRNSGPRTMANGAAGGGTAVFVAIAAIWLKQKLGIQ